MNGKKSSFEEMFYGVATVGDRGQVVIPAKARREFDFSTGDKLLVFAHPYGKGVVLTKIDAVQEFLEHIAQSLQQLQREMNAEDASREEE